MKEIAGIMGTGPETRLQKSKAPPLGPAIVSERIKMGEKDFSQAVTRITNKWN